MLRHQNNAILPSRSFFAIKLPFLLTVFAGIAITHGAIDTLFVIGEHDYNHEPFGAETSASEPAPGSPSVRDDHYYFSSQEPVANFERALTTWDPSSTVYFDLTAAQTNPDGVFSCTVGFLWSGNNNGETATNIVTYRLNGVDFLVTPSFEQYVKFSADVTSLVGLAQAGTNTLEIIRTGGSPGTWLGIDYLELTLDPTANQDTDGDGMPLSWETFYQLSDNDGSDALISSDDDLLSNLEEFLAGTNPRNADSDNDGLDDHLETVTNPLNPDSDDDGLLDGEETTSNPALADTDDDGAFDAWEIRTGYDPSDSASTPPAFAGAIGINFRSEYDEDRGLWSAITPNGWIPQSNWNHTQPLQTWGPASGEPLLTGDTTDIALPTPNTLVDAAGNSLATTITFSYDGCWTSANAGSAAAELLHGFLRSDATFNPTLSLSNIPYSNYDLYLYLSAEYFGPTATVRINGDANTDQTLRVQATAPTQEFIPAYQSAGPYLSAYNTVRLSGLSGTSLTIELIEGDSISGIAGIQVIDTDADADNDLLPDYWELQHRTDAGNSNATADPDNDLLDNASEFALGTDPNNPDTDGDGLSDFVETNSGIFIDASNTGTNPLFGDTDGDGLGDSSELDNPLASNPLLADSDNDGEDDRAEFNRKSDPSNPSFNLLSVPTFPTAGTLLWQVSDIQLIQDHTTPTDTGSRTERDFLTLNVTNATQPDWRNIEFRLFEEQGRLGYAFITREEGGFQHPGGYDLYLGDKTTDYRFSMGFSGFGTHDISDPLTFELSAEANAPPETGWALTFRIINQKTSLVVATEVFPNAVAASSINDQTATWESQSQRPNQATLIPSIGISYYQSAIPLETLPVFAAHLDTDNDGMPDAWEITQGLDENDASDAILDSDGDNLSNREEYLYHTLPGNPDSDSDGVNDDEEIARFSNPTDASIAPPFFQTPLVYNDDLDGNGLPDVWEAAFRATGLLADNDDDGDGYTNAQESVTGTDPLDELSKPFMTLSAPTPETVRMSWPNIPGKNKTLHSTTNLSNWLPVPGTPSATNDLVWQDLGADVSDTFFRVGFEDRNSDSDPLNDWAELALGLSPSDPDSSSRPALFDSDNDGRGDTTIAGDLLYWQQTFANATELRSGGPVTAPTAFDAARLLLQGSFGPTMEDIATVQNLGLEGWIDDQMQSQPITRHGDYIAEIHRDFDGPRIESSYNFNEDGDFLTGGNYDSAFARAAISGPDQLRQRVAFALSQIIVVSRRDDNLSERLVGVSDFYDLLLEHAFGNFEDLLMEVTLHPAMGRYLSHVGNQLPDPTINRYPDENYARELMQLFTIGLWELNQDGTRKLTPANQPILTYSNEEVTHFARVMTGLWFGGNPWGSGGWQDGDYALPMAMHLDYHDFEPKTLLNGVTIPKREPSEANALLDIQDAIRNLFEHPNCAPFICKSLIQFLVTSNPTPEYITRIAAVFTNDGTGERGNLEAVIKAILLDPEARDPAVANSPQFGIVREPVIRTMHLARLTKLNRNEDIVWWDFSGFTNASLQQAMLSPSVFNFFRPDYQAPGVLTENNLVGPALQITNSYSAVSFPNRLWDNANFGFSLHEFYSFPPDYSELLPFADDHPALLDYVNLVVCGGQLNAQTRSIILTALNNSDPDDHPGKVRLALYLAFMSPQGAVQR